MTCSCKLLSVAYPFGETPAYDQSTCPTHGPNAPRYFVDHGMIHDRITGKHVEIEEAVVLLNRGVSQ